MSSHLLSRRLIAAIVAVTMIVATRAAGAQTQIPIPGATPNAKPDVTVGQPSGELALPTILNGTITHGSLSSYHGKLLILDFWATWCSPCIGGMPHMLDIQHQFGDKVQVLLVASDDSATVQKFYAKRPELKLTTAVGQKTVFDSLARRYGVATLGTYVWIDATGTVRAITGQEQVTPENVQAILDGKPVNLTGMATLGVRQSLNPDEPFMIGTNTGGITDFTFHSVLTPFLPGVGAGMSAGGKYGARRVHLFNVPALMLFSTAMGGVQGRVQTFVTPAGTVSIPSSMPYSRIKLETADSARLRDGERSENLYCYELIVPPNRVDNRYAIMLFELERVFGVSATMQHVRTPVYVLAKIGDGPPPSAGGKESESKPLVVQLWNHKASDVASYLEERFSRPVLDETGLTTKFDLEWDDLHKKTPAEIRDILRAHGLDLVDTERDLDMFVIRDAK